MKRSRNEPSIDRADGFEEFARARLPRLLAIARGLTYSGLEAEDLVQDVLAKVLFKWDMVSQTEDPNSYVNRMLVNAATSRWRRGIHREVPSETSLMEDRPVNDESGRIVERDSLLRGLATLKPKQRAVLVLRYYEGLTDHEIADTLGMAHATVRSHVARGLAALRKSGLFDDASV